MGLVDNSDDVHVRVVEGKQVTVFELRVHPDIAWTYDFPTRELSPIAGLIAFYNEKVDVFLDGEPQARPVTHFS